MRCPKCNAENSSTAKFCVECGTGVQAWCVKCGFENPSTANFCQECGASLKPVATSPTLEAEAPPTGFEIRTADERSAVEPRDVPQGERKTVTALFADIQGSMELTEDLDPEEARGIIDPALKLMMDAVHRFDGYIVQSTGDGIFALFGAPVAREDHPARALHAALLMQEQMRSYAERLRADKGINLQVRVGVNTGEVVVRPIHTEGGHEEYTPIGHSTGLAARLQTLANPGSIAISEVMRRLVEGYFLLKPLGPARIKGVSGPLNVYEVTGLGPLRTRLQRSASRGYTKFVGRVHEMEIMKLAADQARAGHGQIVAVMAEPGVGKSRLFFEFKAQNHLGWTMLEALSVSHGKASTFLPVIELLRGYFKISAADDQRVRRSKVADSVLTLDRSLEANLPYLFTLLSLGEGDDPLAAMDEQARKRRTLEAIKRLLLRESLNQPLIVMFEDLHWIDAETQALLDMLADSIATARILLLVNYRPQYAHRWNSKTYYTQLRLDPLRAESAGEMLTTLLGDGAGVAPLKRLIIERTEGNPFFMEEMVQALFEDGALDSNGEVRLTRPLGELKIPTTVQAILASRIDRLPPKEKELLQTLAVVGRRFVFSLLRATVSQPIDELDHMLHDLQLGEFIYEQPSASDPEYSFKHALTREVAYNSVLLERRRMLHERIGDAMEALFEAHLEDYYDDLAYHYSCSGNRQKAALYVQRANQRAALQSFDRLEDYLRDLRMKE
jgi:class 3 adenylate cyclase/ribosomal protein L40E